MFKTLINRILDSRILNRLLIWHDLYFPNEIYAVQRRLIKRYDGWRKLYTVLHGFAPYCTWCVNGDNQSACFREMMRKNEHPCMAYRTECCVHFRLADNWSLVGMREVYQKDLIRHQASLRNAKE